MQDAAAQRAAPLLIGARPARPAPACSMPAPRRAARRRTCSSLPTSTCWRSTATRRGWRGCRTTLDRLGLRARLLAADAGDPAAWWDGVPFDAILLDAPCSASGIVRRHPDVRWLRRASDIAALARRRRGCSMRCGRCSRRAGGCCTAPVRSSGPRARTRSTLFCNARAAPGRRSAAALAGAPAAAARQCERRRGADRRGRARRLLLRVARKGRPLNSVRPLLHCRSAAARGRGSLRARAAWARGLAAAGRACWPGRGTARAESVELSTFSVARSEEGVLLSFSANFELPRSVEDALIRGVPLYFEAEAKLLQSRWYWRDKRVAHATRSWRLTYQPLTRMYRVSTGRPEPELRDAGRGAGLAAPQLALEARRAGPGGGRRRATTSSSASASTPRCCRARCRSASAARRRGRCRSSARSA